MIKGDPEFEEWRENNAWGPPATDTEIDAINDRAVAAGDRETYGLTSEVKGLRFLVRLAMSTIDSLGEANSPAELSEIMEGGHVKLIRSWVEARKP